MRLKANKYLRGSALVADPGQEFDCDAETAASLIASGAADPVPHKVERAVEAFEVEKAVEAPEVAVAEAPEPEAEPEAEPEQPPRKTSGEKPAPPRKRAPRKVNPNAKKGAGKK